MNAEIITIGDEILIGQITDTNSQYIATQLNNIGISVYQITSIQDNKYHIQSALQQAESNVDIIIITGGLGPTKDDVTKKTLTEYFNDELVLNATVLEHIQSMFAKRNIPFGEMNRQQAFLPSKCEVLHNELGTASGMLFRHKGNIIVSLPGVPYEMKGLLKQVLPKLQDAFELPHIMHKTIITYGMGESAVAERIADFEDNLPNTIKLAYLPSSGKLRLRLSGKSDDKKALENTMHEQVTALTALVDDIIVGFEDAETAEMMVGKLLTANKQTIATAESCTAGALAKQIASVAGASNYFLGSIVSYANEVKIRQLNVSEALIKEHTAVSPQVAKAMATQTQKIFESDYAIAITGNAGPTQANPKYDVGVVFIALATPKSVEVYNFSFGKPRSKVITRATNKALELLRKEIIKNT